MPKKQIPNLVIQNARIFFKNFAGREGQYNRSGDRNFCVAIEDAEQAQAMIADGWNVKISKPRDEDDEPGYYIRVKVKFGDYPPMVKLHTVNNPEGVSLDEDTVGQLDDCELERIDLEISPYAWEMNGKTGVTAYLKKMHAQLHEEAWEQDWSGQKEA